MSNLISKILVCGLLGVAGYCTGQFLEGYRVHKIVDEHRNQEYSMINQAVQECDSQLKELEGKVQEFSSKKEEWKGKEKEVNSYNPQTKGTKMYDRVMGIKEKVTGKGNETYENIKGGKK